MTEVSFAKLILTTLDQRPSKITADHIEDPRRYPAQNAYILPRMPKPPSKPKSSTSATPGTSPSSTSPTTYTVTLTSTRNPPLSLTLPSLPPTTSIHNLKTSLSIDAFIPVEKLKILWNKRPVPDSKVIKDFLGGDDDDVGQDGKLEFGILVIGGAASVVAKAVEGHGEVEVGEVAAEGSGGMAAPVAQGVSGLKAIESAEFWSDLEGFLMQRTRDEVNSKKLLEVFKAGYEQHKAEF